MLEEYEDGSILKVQILMMPEGQDPDQFIRGFGDLRTGVCALQKLTRIDLETWNHQAPDHRRAPTLPRSVRSIFP